MHSKTFYCSMRFRSSKGIGWRYDAQCMVPANEAAVRVKEMLSRLLPTSQTERIEWAKDVAAVLCNWQVLHGRGPSPQEENHRLLERIYVG